MRLFSRVMIQSLLGLPLFLTLLWPHLAIGATGAETQEGCFVSHLNEARAINKERRDSYAQWTNGESRMVSWILITSEWASLPFAHWVEGQNQPLAAVGVNIACEDFVSMAHTPPLMERSDQQPQPLDHFESDRGWSEWGDLWDLAWDHSYPELAVATDRILADLESVPTYHCMYRHILESIRLAALNASGQLDRARQYDLEARAKRVINALIYSQVGVLPLGFWIDKLVAPINAQGIPMVCQDVPPIGGTAL